MAYKEQLQKLEQEWEYYQKENENSKREPVELVQKLSEEREHYQREDEQRKIEYEQMVSKTQTPSCMVMDVTKNTHKENGNLQANIKTTRDFVNKLNDRTRKAILTIGKRLQQLEEEREHFRNENENQKLEHMQLAEFAETMRKTLMMETNIRMAETNSTEDYFTSQIRFIRD